MTEDAVMDKLIACVHEWTQRNNIDGVVIRDDSLWKSVCEAFDLNVTETCLPTEHVAKEHEERVMQSVQNQLNHNVFYTRSDQHLNIQQSRRTRRKRPLSHKNMKYHRELYIS